MTHLPRRGSWDGEVAEWLKATVSKTVMGHWPIESSNLSLSATSRFRSGPFSH